LYGIKKKLPIVPGFEASGTVVATGGDLVSRFFMGRRVACAASNDGDGSWAEYMLAPVGLCILLRKNISFEQGATAIINPLSAWALMGMARRGRHKAIAQTAAASALGRMMIQLGRRFNIETINIVRREEQVSLLKSLGATHVLNSNDPNFEAELQTQCRDLKATLAFDAVAGEMTGRLLRALPRNGRVTVYGALSLEASQIDAGQFVFRNKSVDGFWLSTWLSHQTLLSVLLTANQTQSLLTSDLKTEIRARLALNEAAAGLAEYTSQMTGGKILFTPSSF
jgi:NADPH2:quinone reductase